MTEPLPTLSTRTHFQNKGFIDRNKLSRHFLGLTLALALTAVAGGSASVAQAKEKTDEVPAASHPGPGPGAHACLPPGPPPGPMFDGPAGPPPPPPMALPLMGVDLSDDQLDKLSQLHVSFRERSEPSMVKLHALEDQFRRTLASSTLNVEELNGLRSKITAEKATLDSAMGDFAIAQAQVLTPEQRHKIKIDMERFEVRSGFGPHFGPPKP